MPLNGIYLTLMIGPAVPVPVPQVVLDSLASVEVISSDARGESGFSLTFNVDSKSPLYTILLLAGGALPPILRCLLIVTLQGRPNVLIDGIITNTEVSPPSGSGHATLTVRGKDPTVLMEKVEFTGFPYPAMPVEARVALIIAKYAFFGMIPLVIPTLFPEVPIPIERIPTHQGTDLAYLDQLAAQAGYVFYIEPGPEPFTNLAYWGPKIKFGPPQKALNLDLDAHKNTMEMSFNFEKLENTLPIVFIHNQLTKFPIPIPIPNINPLQPPLGVIPPPPTQIKMMKETAKLSPMQAIQRGLAEAAGSQDAVTASGSMDVVRYGGFLRARQLVGVRGAGLAFDGLYYIRRVTSTLKRGEFKQRFDLTRNGLVSITPKVPV